MSAKGKQLVVTMAQCAVPTCAVHRHEEVDMYCKDCALPICEKCAQKDHNHHRFTNLAKYVRQKRSELKQTDTDIRTIQNPGIDQTLRDIEQTRKRNTDLCKGAIETILQHKTKLIDAITHIADRHIAKLQTDLQEINGELGRKTVKFSECKKAMTEQVETLDGIESTVTDHEFIRMYNNLQKLVNNTGQPDLSRLNYQHPPFVPGCFNYKILEDVIGHFQDEERATQGNTAIVAIATYDPVLTQISEFKYKGKTYGSISTIADNKILMCNADTQSLQSYTIKGEFKRIKDIGMLLNDWVPVSDSEELVASPGTKSINLIDKDGNSSVVMTTGVFTPVGVNLTLKGDILVTLCDKNPTLFDKDKIKSKVLIIDRKGKVLKSYEFAADAKTTLFVGPIRAVQNYNTDICVTDKTGETTGEVHILDEAGPLKCVYRGGTGARKFYPADICCDYNCNIIIADGNKKIHLVSHDGQFMKLLLSSKSAKPWSLGLYREKLWIGYRDSRVAVYKYGY